MAKHQHTAGNHTRTCDYDLAGMRDVGMCDAFAGVNEVQEPADRVTDVQTDVRQLIGDRVTVREGMHHQEDETRTREGDYRHAEVIRQELRALREEVNGIREELKEAKQDVRAVMLAYDELQDDFVTLRQRFEQRSYGATHPRWAEHQPRDADGPEMIDPQSCHGGP